MLFIEISGLSSCTSKCTCEPALALRPSLVSFPVNDIDTFILLKFTKGSDFTKILDSALIDTNNSIYTTHNDTTDINTGIGNAVLSSKYDYEIFFPSLHEFIKIANIVEPQVEGNCPEKTLCVNPIKSYEINGNLIVKENPYDGMIYIHK